MFFHRFLSVPRMNFTFTLLSKTFERCERFFLFPPLFFFHVYVFLENFSISQVFFSLFFMFTFSYETFERWLIIKTRGWRGRCSSSLMRPDQGIKNLWQRNLTIDARILWKVHRAKFLERWLTNCASLLLHRYCYITKKKRYNRME